MTTAKIIEALEGQTRRLELIANILDAWATEAESGGHFSRHAVPTMRYRAAKIREQCKPAEKLIKEAKAAEAAKDS